MSTRGTLIIKGERYFIGSDAYPSHAHRVLRKAVMVPKTLSSDELIRRANEIAGFTWIQYKLKKGERFGYPFEEYRWIVDLRKKTVRQDVQYRKSFDRRIKAFVKKHYPKVYKKLRKKKS